MESKEQVSKAFDDNLRSIHIMLTHSAIDHREASERFEDLMNQTALKLSLCALSRRESVTVGKRV